MTRLAGCALFVAAAVAGALPAAADGPSAAPGGACAAPSELIAIGPALVHAAARVERDQPLTIVAVGSSSTAGVGASGPNLNYPSQLQAELSRRFHDSAIRVINRGKSGEDATEELARLDHDVVAEHPDLVIWQVGTNAVLHHEDLAADGERIERGIAQLKRDGADVVLMDLQYASRVIARPAFETMEQLIAGAAKSGRAGLFRRFDIMRYWQNNAPSEAPQMIGPDGVHMTDLGYHCIAVDLAQALASNWRAYESAAAHPGEAAIARFTGAVPVFSPDGDDRR
jgi:lysophospholipase L1-like esterase